MHQSKLVDFQDKDQSKIKDNPQIKIKGKAQAKVKRKAKGKVEDKAQRKAQNKNKKKDLENINIFNIKDGFVSHPLIQPNAVVAKDFQLNIASKALTKSTLVVLPTGIGKTIVAILVSAELFNKSKDSDKIVMLAPTRPLVEQHKSSFEHFLKITPTVMFTGSINPKKRIKEWEKSRIIFSTPQTMRNDLEQKRYDLSKVSLLIVDEAHRCVGDYAYTSVLSNYNGLVLALTASPGGDNEKITEVIDNLKVELVDARTDRDDDVRGHVKGIEIEWLKTVLTDDMIEIKKLFEEFLLEKVKKLRKLGFVRKKSAKLVSKKDILQARAEITKRYARNKGLMFGSLHNQSQAVLAYHCVELLETQGVYQCGLYLDRMGTKEKRSKAEKGFLGDLRIRKSISLIKAHKGHIRPTCGLHIHIDMSKFKPQEIINIIKAFLKKQNKIYKEFNVLKSRTTDTAYKIPRNVTRYINTKIVKELIRDKRTRSDHSYFNDKYYGLNIESLTRHYTLEFRLFNGTIQTRRIKKYVKWCINFCLENK